MPYLAYELLAKTKNLEAELQLFRSVEKFDIDMRASSHCAPAEKNELILVETETETETETESLKNSVLKKNLGMRGSRVNARRAILNSKGEMLFERGFVPEIRKVI